jgi:hypothetical protein
MSNYTDVPGACTNELGKCPHVPHGKKQSLLADMSALAFQVLLHAITPVPATPCHPRLCHTPRHSPSGRGPAGYPGWWPGWWGCCQ